AGSPGQTMTGPMRILIPLAAIAGGAAVGLTVGLALRGLSSHWHASDAASTPASRTGAASTHDDKKAPRARPVPIEQSSLAAQLAHNLATTTGVTKWLCWWDAIEKAKPEDFPALARLANGNAIATRLVAQRWVETAPKHFFQTLVAASRAGN